MISESGIAKFRTLRDKIMQADFSRMNEKQRQAVFAVKGPVLILAGAGSGKTTTLVNRIACILKYGSAYGSGTLPRALEEEDITYLEQCLKSENFNDGRLSRLLAVENAPAWSILAITFTNKAANELKERLASMLGEQASEVWACTFHSACVRILRREIEKLGLSYTGAFTIYDTDDSVRVLRELCKEIDDERSFANKVALPTISRAKEKYLDAAAYEREVGNDFRLKRIAEIYRKYEQALRSANAVDFDDIIMLTVRLFETCPDVLEYYQRRFRYLLVDEYQDTNHIQYRLVSLLAGAHHNICVVGDDDQSIYSFRGATIENILNFEKQFADAKVIKLEQNYRSTSSILDAANAVISNNDGRKGKSLWTENGKGDLISICRFEDDFGESQFFSNTILEDVKNGETFSSHAILYRMNAQSAAIERSFVRNGIPYRIIGGFRFYERMEIKDILSYLVVLINPNDNLYFKRIINVPKRSIGSATIAAAESIAAQTGQSLYEVFRNCRMYDYFAKKLSRIESFMDFLEQTRVLVDKIPLGELITRVIEGSGYLEQLKAEDSKEGKDRIENLNTLVNNAVQYEKEAPEAALAGFLEDAALMADIDNYDRSADAVVMMTVHSAKGLEFPVVFMAGMEEGVFPSQNSSLYPNELEEERRLAYVGITRAKKKLYMTYAKVRMMFGSTVYNRPSRFVEEIPEEYRELVGQAAQPARPRIDKRPMVQAPAATGARFGYVPPAKSTATFSKGDVVTHNTFGKGLVLNVKPMGGDLLLEVAFDTYGTKKLMANYANLTKC